MIYKSKSIGYYVLSDTTLVHYNGICCQIYWAPMDHNS